MDRDPELVPSTSDSASSSDMEELHNFVVDENTENVNNVKKEDEEDMTLKIHFQEARHQEEHDKEIKDHLMDFRELESTYGTSLNEKTPQQSKGLTSEEASVRLEKYGRNALTPSKTTPLWVLFFKEFIGVFSLMLEIAGIGCFASYGLNKKPENLFLGIILWLVVIISATLNFMQVRKSSKVMNSFGTLVAAETVVLRDGNALTVNSEELVIGDLVRIKGGDKVPADVRLFSCSGLKVDNSSLTGESEPQTRSATTKETDPLEAHNLIFLGTLAVEGEAYGVVTRTGDRTMLGRTASLVSKQKTELTVLQKEIQTFVKRVSFIGIVVGIIVLVISVSTGVYWLDSIIFGVGSVVAIVPEGLQLTVTLALTLTASRMAKQNILVKKLSIVETLGSTSVICSDKTGTLTQNRMTVSYVAYNLEIHNCETLKHSANKFNENDEGFKLLVRAAGLCSRSSFDASDKTTDIHKRKIIGDASEAALLRFVSSGLLEVEEERLKHPKVFEIPFNSMNKWQLSIHKDDEKPDRQIALMKGAPERIIGRCSTILFEGQEIPITEDHVKQLDDIIAELGSIGQRVMGFAQLNIKAQPSFDLRASLSHSALNLPTSGLCFLGFIAMYDPPRENVDKAIQTCQDAGIKVAMVTGDHPATAAAIARQIGIIREDTPEELMKKSELTKEEAIKRAPAMVITGSELDSLSDEMWDIITSKTQLVFARTSPEQKLQIVSHFQKKGEIVAVTGDGVNDSPALKRSDVGVAMGIAGSEVAKEAADIILMDDNFATIVKAVEEGRLIFDNLKKSIAYALSAKLPEVLPFLSFVIIGLPLPLSTVLVLCIDIGTDLIPGIALAYERPENNMMKRKPRNPQKHRLVSMKLIFFSFIQIGVLQALSGFTSYFITMNSFGFPPSSLPGVARKHFQEGAPDLIINGVAKTEADQLEALASAQTSFFVSIILTQLADSLACKTRYLSLFQVRGKNYLQAFGLMLAVFVAVVFSYVPQLQYVLKTASLTWEDWVFCLPFSVGIFGLDEIRKLIIRKYPQGIIAKYTYW